jgi:hypothetical protein
LTVACHACQCDCRDEELLESSTIIINFMLMTEAVDELTCPCWWSTSPC